MGGDGDGPHVPDYGFPLEPPRLRCAICRLKANRLRDRGLRAVVPGGYDERAGGMGISALEYEIAQPVAGWVGRAPAHWELGVRPARPH